MSSADSTATTGLPLPAGDWHVDRGRSRLAFNVKTMWGALTVKGVFTSYEGELRVSPEGGAGTLTIQADSLDTKNKKRDQHLRSADFFDAAANPTITFATTSITPRAGGAAVKGELRIGERTVPLDLAVDVDEPASGELRLRASTVVSREAAGLVWNRAGMIRGDALLDADVVLVQG